MKSFFYPLINWFNSSKREFPWRNEITFYRVWVSEVMLQQTRADVVVPYFEKWMKEFPTLEALANAPVEKVIKCWEGLGYYSRARNLHIGAKQIVESKIPTTEQELKSIKGIGPYTTGAILSFVYQKKTVAIDGNVLRVISRLFCIEDAIDLQTTKNKISQLVLTHLPDTDSHIVNEALIELGALVCQKKPKCDICPLRKKCKAHLQSKTEILPVKTKRQKTIFESRVVLIIKCDQKFLLKKNGEKLMKDLHEFPYFSFDKDVPTVESLLEYIDKAFAFPKISFEQKLPIYKHTFTRYRVSLYPFVFHTEKANRVESFFWEEKELIDKLAFSSGHRKIKESLF